MKNLKQDSHFLDQDLNLGPPEYQARWFELHFFTEITKTSSMAHQTVHSTFINIAMPIKYGQKLCRQSILETVKSCYSYILYTASLPFPHVSFQRLPQAVGFPHCLSSSQYGVHRTWAASVHTFQSYQMHSQLPTHNPMVLPLLQPEQMEPIKHDKQIYIILLSIT
jgi:hypothetical protein